MKKKKFDCVEMKHKAQEKIWRKLRKMTKAQQLAYWQEASERFRKQVEEIRGKLKTKTKVSHRAVA